MFKQITARDIKYFVRNTSTESRFCFCRMTLSLTASVVRLPNTFSVMKRPGTVTQEYYRQNWYAFSELGRTT